MLLVLCYWFTWSDWGCYVQDRPIVHTSSIPITSHQHTSHQKGAWVEEGWRGMEGRRK